MPQSEHAKYAPSSAARTVQCPASPRMVASVPEQEDTEESRQGTASHWGVSELLSGRQIAVGQVAPNSETLNEEMTECAEFAADYIMERGPVGWVEFTLPASDNLHRDNWGTPDHAYFDFGSMTLYVDDYKYGHKFIDAFQNWQLVDYVLLLLEFLGMVDGQTDQAVKVVMTIIQPRNYHPIGPVRVWETTGAELRGHRNILRAAFEAADRPDAICKSGSECEYCPARHACPAACMAGFTAMEHACQPIVMHMTPQAMGLELAMLKRCAEMLKARMTGLEEQVLSNISRGKPVPRFAIAHEQGRRVWLNAEKEAEIIELARILNPANPVDIAKPSVAVTPKQAIKKGVPQEIVAAYSHTPRGAAKLVEVTGHAVSRIFSK